MRTQPLPSVIGLALAVALGATLSSSTVYASGHGPVFGGATPTLGKGAWSFDQAWMGQAMRGSTKQEQLLRTMISLGITEKVQISGSVPVPLQSSGMMPSGRMMAMMPGTRDFEALVGWRFHTRPTGVGARIESTIYVGGLVPFDATRAGIATSPGAFVAIASGYASREHYFWVGASHQRHATRSNARAGAVSSTSVVYGYRPSAWRLEYPGPDLRFFIEAVGDKTEKMLHDGRLMADSGGQVVLVGPSLLLLYRAYGIGAGVLLPVYQRTNGVQAEERLRFGANFAYFFWPR